MERSGIQFVTSGDGTPIAFWTVGDGPPLVVIHNFVLSHSELEWNIPSFRALYEDLAEHHQVIRLDPRGAGLSGGHMAGSADDDGFLDEVAGDVEAVVDALGHAEFDLVAAMTMSPVGVRLATRGRVERLVLCDPLIDIPNATEFDRYMRAAKAVAAVDPTTTVDVISRLWTHETLEEDKEPFREVFTANTTDDVAWSGPLLWNAFESLEEVSAPTLVIYTKDGLLASPSQARRAATGIPDATLVRIEGRIAPYWVDRGALLGAFGEFLGWEMSDRVVPSEFSVIVFTDIVASTEVVDRLGDEAAREAVRSVEVLVADTALRWSGRVIKHLGDGSLLEFRSASSALEFAREAQAGLGVDGVSMRVGMAAGEPIHEDGDVHGAVVVVASRIAGVAGAGDVFVSDGVRQLVVGKSYKFADLGEQPLKGFDEPVRAWRLEL